MRLKNTSVKFLVILMATLSCTFSYAPHASGQNFEGIIHYNIPQLKDEINTSKLDYMIRNNQIRIEYQAKSKKTALLYDQQSKTMFLNLSSLGGYVEVPPNDIAKNIRFKDVQFTDTGETKTMAGRKCTVAQTTLGGETYHYCFASGMGNFILPVNSMTSGSVPAWASFRFPANRMPLQVIRMKNGKAEKTLMQAEQIESKTLNRNLFSVLNR